MCPVQCHRRPCYSCSVRGGSVNSTAVCAPVTELHPCKDLTVAVAKKSLPAMAASQQSDAALATGVARGGRRRHRCDQRVFVRWPIVSLTSSGVPHGTRAPTFREWCHTVHLRHPEGGTAAATDPRGEGGGWVPHGTRAPTFQGWRHTVHLRHPEGSIRPHPIGRAPDGVLRPLRDALAPGACSIKAAGAVTAPGR